MVDWAGLLQSYVNRLNPELHGWVAQYSPTYFDNPNFRQALDPRYDHYGPQGLVHPTQLLADKMSQIVRDAFIDSNKYQRLGNPFGIRALTQSYPENVYPIKK